MSDDKLIRPSKGSLIVRLRRSHQKLIQHPQIQSAMQTRTGSSLTSPFNLIHAGPLGNDLIYKITRNTLVSVAGFIILIAASSTLAQDLQPKPPVPYSSSQAKELVTNYCLDCHGEEGEGGLNLSSLLEKDDLSRIAIFENLMTARMPPQDADQPTAAEKSMILEWLANLQTKTSPPSYRRISRYEFENSVNDLLETDLKLAEVIPEDRGTHGFDSNRGIKLTKEMLAAYFTAADKALDFALPDKGIPQELTWKTNKIKDSHDTYNIYARKYKQGNLFSWTRANNGNNYSFFFDNFEPLVEGWYELTFDAAKLGDFRDHVTIQVYAGKYYYADDRPQPQRLLDVVSLGHQEIKPHTIRAFLNPGENISVHCYSKHTWRQKEGQQGAYIKQLRVRGPVLDDWPPKSYQTLFAGLPLDAPLRETENASLAKTTLEKIGGRLDVSSFQIGMEKERMLDGSNKTFWHTRFKPTLAKPPHFVILENPAGRDVTGLSYSTWSGGNGNGQVKMYSVYESDDGETWDSAIISGTLEVRLAAEQKIIFPTSTKKRFIKFLVNQAVSLDDKSLASIGKLDVLTESHENLSNAKIRVKSTSKLELKKVIKRFAEKAFSSTLTETEMAPYYQASLHSFNQQGDFIEAAKLGLKAVLCSPRYLLAPGVHPNGSYQIAAELARSLWLSVPDEPLLKLAKTDQLSAARIRKEIDRMLDDQRALRMVSSFATQWLNLRSFHSVSPSLKLYPAYDDLLEHYLPLETEAYLHHLIQENLPVTCLIDSNFSILNQRLARHYGIEGVVGQTMRKILLKPEIPRGGMLTMGSVLKVTTDGFQTSPILRGAWISKNIVGNTLSPPPENIAAIESDSNGAETLKQQIKEHLSNDSCLACHKSIDPYGFALENFDATGHWRTKYRVQKPHHSTFQYRLDGYYDLAGEVDASGEVNELKFNNIQDLKKILLLDHKRVAYNFAKKYFEYVNGYQPTLRQRISLHALIPFQAQDCRMGDLIKDVLVYSLTGDRR